MDELRVEIEVERTSPTAFRVFSCHLFDYFLFILLAGLLFFLIQLGSSSLAPVKEAWATRDRIQEESSLYIRKEERLVNLGSHYEKSGLAYSYCIDDLSSRLTAYFTSYFTPDEWKEGPATYKGKLSEGKGKNGEKLFGENGERLLTNADYDETYFRFYVDLAKDTAPGYLNYKKGYSESRRTIVVSYIMVVEVSMLISYVLVFVVFGLIFHRGKQTLGMKLSRVFYLDVNALSPSWQRYLLFRLLHYLFMVVASPFVLLIPFFISVAMMLIRKEKQTLFEYIFALFPIDAKKEDIYETVEELELKN